MADELRLIGPLTFEQQVSLGYLSAGVRYYSAFAYHFSVDSTSSRSFSPLLQKAGSGIKLVSFGAALGFPDGNTLNAYVSPSTGILLISDKVFDSLPLSGYASRVVYGDDGRFWWIENGQSATLHLGHAIKMQDTLQFKLAICTVYRYFCCPLAVASDLMC